MAKVTIPYKKLPWRVRLCVKHHKKPDGTYELRLRWWYALVFALQFAFAVRFEAVEDIEIIKNISAGD